MASFSNLAFDTIRRLRNDETGEITLLFTRNGVPMNISDMVFSVGYNTSQTATEILRLNESDLIRPANTTDRLVIDPTPEQRKKLTADAYTIWVYLVVGGRRDPIVYYKYSWEVEPAGFTAGQPREPAFMRIDFITATAITPTTSVYEINSGGSVAAPGIVPGIASEAAATSAALPAGAAGQFFIIAGKPFLKVDGKLLGLAYTLQDV